MSEATDIIEHLRGQQANLAATMPGADWLDGLRDKGMARFAETGLPQRKWEAWRYTNVNALKQALGSIETNLAGEQRPGDTPALAGDAYRVVLVNGRFRAELSALDGLPDGIEITGLADALRVAPDLVREHLQITDDTQQPLAALNTAFLADGYVLRLGDGARLDRPLEITFLNGNGLSQPHNLIIAGANSQATVIEHHISNGESYIANSVTRACIGDGADIARYKLQREADAAQHYALFDARIGRDARLANFELSAGAAVAHSASRIDLAEPGADLRLDGIYLGQKRQETASVTTITHSAGDTASSEIYKGVLDDQARAVFQGKISVRPDAQRINGQQLNKTLLLSDQAEIDTKPELEILADDVKCSHGATAGELDENALFYLRSRGIPEGVARGMLIEAFLGEVTERIAHEQVRDAVAAIARNWLDNHAPGARA
jgi:Fe-S cluster assembly protein SufD